VNLRAESTRSKGRRSGLVRLQQQVQLRRRYVAQIPRWRHPLVGYLISIPVMGLDLLAIMAGRLIFPGFYFPGVAMFLAVVVMALFWGVGPAFFTVLLSSVALYYFYLPSLEPATGPFFILSWEGLLDLAPFIVSGIIIAIITGQRESARLRALFAEQEANAQAYELEQANRELEQANALKDQFLSMASHELKTPITSISGQSQVALRRLAKKGDLPDELLSVRTTLERINEQTRRLNTLVDDLLSLSSLRSGKINLRLSPCDAGEICRSVVEEQRLISGRALELALPGSPVIVEADSDRLGQVVTNLVSNALKYSDQSAPVGVVVSSDATHTRIEVQDAGRGISQVDLEHIFDTFYRSPDAQTSKQNGWGLGLAICKDIVERHGGRIWAESQPGQGSTFFVELPLK
jgi:signal transduction histidine kinase